MAGKRDLVLKVAKAGRSSQKSAAQWIGLVLTAIGQVLSQKGDLTLPGFGRFRVKEVPARDGIDPKTKKKIKVPAGVRVSFRPGKGLKERLKAQMAPEAPKATAKARKK